MADAIATSFGAVLGTSTTTTFVESASGVAVGGRTGLTALVSALLFLLSTLFAPILRRSRPLRRSGINHGWLPDGGNCNRNSFR